MPRSTFQFYWTSNEVAVAGQLGPWYYLYLVPVGDKGKLMLDDLKIVRDPCSVVMGAKEKWIVETGLLRCTLSSQVEPNGNGREEDRGN